MESQTFTSAQNRSEFIDLLEQEILMRKQFYGSQSDMIMQVTGKEMLEVTKFWGLGKATKCEVDVLGVWTRAKMKIRAMQIWGFLLAVLGWIFVSCSMAMEGWKISSIGGQGGSAIISVGWYWSSLWRACFTDSTSTSNCYDFPVLWSVEGMGIIRVFESTCTILLMAIMKK